MTQATAVPSAPRWDLESIFPGGSASKDYRKFRQETKQVLEDCRNRLERLPEKLSKNTLDDWSKLIIKLESVREDISLIESFAGCLTAQDVTDSEADAITSEADNYHAEWQVLMTEFEAMALEQSDEAWSMLTRSESLSPISFYLNELRDIAKSKMPVEQESLALELAVDGYHAWNRLYDKMAGELKAEFSENGQTRIISMGQLATKMSSPDRGIRRQAFEKLTEAWKSREDLAAMALNAQGGFRLTLYRNREWESALKEPLQIARLQQETLDTMWRVIREMTPRLQPYVEAKKKLLGINDWSWYDQFAPCGSSERIIPFDEAGDFIVKHIGAFSKDMASFCKLALDNRWIEAEDRPGKRGGGFCTSMWKKRQSRIFMTYAGTYENLLTLAHELGHAYHSYVLRDERSFARFYPMTLAETASTFAEAVVTDAALDVSTDAGEKLMLVDQKLQGAYTMFCDIQSRSLFDKMFYEERQKGTVGAKKLRELMLEAQKQSFGGTLDSSGYHPLFWCSKLHFYITDVPFYNFPYTFGFLFSAGIYDRAKKEGPSFADKYAALLKDTGRMTTEELAKKHLGVDLTKDAFWKDACALALADVDMFVELSKMA